MDHLVNAFKPVSEGFVHVADSVKLRVIRTFHGAIVADKLISVIAVVA